MKKEEIERRKFDEKNKQLEEKEYVKNTKLEDWFKKQASKIEQEAYIKKMKSNREKEEKDRIEEIKKAKELQSTAAYNDWMKRKENEKKLTTKSSKVVSEKRKKTNDQYSSSKNEENHTNQFKISIGPYSTGKALRKIEKKLTNDFQVMSYLEGQEKEKKTKKGIDESFQDLSSIKKDTPENENVGDDYE